MQPTQRSPNAKESPSAKEIEAQLRALAGKEGLRARAQGHGRPIISTLWKGRRVVAVNDRVFFGEWRLFTDFLMHHMWTVIDAGAPTPLRSEAPEHPLVIWQEHMWGAQPRGEGEQRTRASTEPDVAALIRLAYALYLIAHNDRLSPLLIKRLRDPVQFRPVALETYVAAAFALAGYGLAMGELKAGPAPEPEFIATAPSGRQFSVEAKRKDRWTVVPQDPGAGDEIRRWLRHKLYASAKKKLSSPVYWLDLAMPGNLSVDEVTVVLASVRTALRDAESNIRINGETPAPAYVFVSSFGFLAKGGANTSVTSLDGFHIRFVDFDGTNLDEALIDRGRHPEMRWILRCAREIQAVPHTFDGTPDALLDAKLLPIDGIRVGQQLRVPLPDGSVHQGVIKFVAPSRDAALVCLIQSDGSEVVVQVPLTPDEQRASQTLGEAAFGQPQSKFEIDHRDPLGVYDFFVHSYRTASREQLLRHLTDVAGAAEDAPLDDEELRRLVARRYAKWFLLRRGQRGAPAAVADAHG